RFCCAIKFTQIAYTYLRKNTRQISKCGACQCDEAKLAREAAARHRSREWRCRLLRRPCGLGRLRGRLIGGRRGGAPARGLLGLGSWRRRGGGAVFLRRGGGGLCGLP